MAVKERKLVEVAECNYNELVFEMHTKKVLSENTNVIPTRKGRRLSLIKSPTSREYFTEIFNYLDKFYYDELLNNTEELKKFFSNNIYQCTWIYHINNRIDSRDLTNMKKAIEDIVVQFVNRFESFQNYDDSLHYIDRSIKVYNNSGTDKIILRLEPISELKLLGTYKEYSGVDYNEGR